MFCDNASYETQKMTKNCVNYCSGQDNYMPSYNNLHTEQSQRNPSHYYQTLSQREQQHKPQKQMNNVNLREINEINEMQALQVMHEHTKTENEQLKAITRNKKIAALLSTIIAFSQRIEGIKQKLAGYPAESFAPVQFFNVLDLTEKGYVDLYDVKRFVNNEKITQNEILSLFKKVNGDHSKDNSRLSYFGYLNLIKPYFNEHLARDLLLRDSMSKAKKQSHSSSSNKKDFDIIQPTQQSVLLLFQQLMLLHCICVSEHEQAKEELMGEYMLNVMEIKQIIGLDNMQMQIIQNLHEKFPSPSFSKPSSLPSTPSPLQLHKSPLKLLYDFISINSQYQLQFKQTKFLLSFLINAHEYQLTNQKYLSLLFIPMNCKKQLMRHFQSEQQRGQNNVGNHRMGMERNYMNTYLTRENLVNKGNVQPIKEYFRQNGVNSYNNNQQKQYNQQGMSLTQNHMNLLRSTSSKNKMNFLQFVHPKSLQRMGVNNNNLPLQQYMQEQQPNIMYSHQQYNNQQLLLPNQHPQLQQINPSNKYLILSAHQQQQNQNNPSINILSQQQQQRKQYSNNNPSQSRINNIPQQSIRVNNVPKQSKQKKQYPSLLYQQHKREILQQQQPLITMNTSNISHTPFLEKFMKNNNINNNGNNNRKMNQHRNIQQINQDYSKISDSKISDSAFQVLDYGYQINDNIESSNKFSKNKKYCQKQQQQQLSSKYPNTNKIDQSQRFKKQSLDSRYNLVVSQYKNSQLYPNNKNNYNDNNPNRKVNYNNPVLEHSKGNNYILDSVGLSQSNMVNNNQSNFMNKFYTNNNNNDSLSGGGNILNEFLKK